MNKAVHYFGTHHQPRNTPLVQILKEDIPMAAWNHCIMPREQHIPLEFPSCLMRNSMLLMRSLPWTTIKTFLQLLRSVGHLMKHDVENTPKLIEQTKD